MTEKEKMESQKLYDANYDKEKAILTAMRTYFSSIPVVSMDYSLRKSSFLNFCYN